MKEDYWFSGAAFVSGIGVWALVSALSGRQEAWDSEWYLRLGVPVLCLVTGVLGFIEPQHVWRWGILPAAGQAAGMYVSQEIGNLWPLGLIAFGILALPTVIAAKLGAKLAVRFSQRALPR